MKASVLIKSPTSMDEERSKIEVKVNFDAFTDFPLLLFRLALFDFEPLNSNSSWRDKLKFYARLNYFRLVTFSNIFAVSSFLVYIYVNSNDFAAASKGIPNIATSMVMCLKGIVTYLNRHQIHEIMQELRLLIDSRWKFEEEMRPHLNRYNLIVRAYAMAFFGTFFSIAMRIVPYILFGEMKLTVFYWFPFEIYQQETFLIALLLIDWFTYTLLGCLLAADALLYSFIEMLTIEFEILRIELQNLKFGEEIERKQKVSKLKGHHNKLLDLCDKLQSMYSLTFLFSFVISSLIMCCVAFQLSPGNANVDAYMFYIPYMGMMGGQILLLCHFAQALIDSTVAVAEGAFDSGWESFNDNDLKKQIMQIIQRAQRPKNLTAMNFATISRESFTNVSANRQL